jgi:hypothetical protein
MTPIEIQKPYYMPIELVTFPPKYFDIVEKAWDCLGGVKGG